MNLAARRSRRSVFAKACLCAAALAGLASTAACGQDPEPSAGGACPDGTVVGSERALERALAGAGPGDVIVLADGRYRGDFVIERSGRDGAPIVLCGGPGAVLDAGSVERGYTLHLDGASHWRLIGFGVTGGAKGLMLDGASDNEVLGLSVTDVGDEAVHLRTGSSRNLLQGLTIARTGLRQPEYGEGIYVGSAESNWCELTGCEPDRSDDNRLIGNTVRDTTAEAVDLKEGTTGGVLRDNRLDGTGSTEADSLVDVKGNGWRITGTRGTAAPRVGVHVLEVVDGWGRDNVVRGNRLHVPADGWAVELAGDVRGAGNVVACDNIALVGGREQPARLAPTPCTP